MMARTSPSTTTNPYASLAFREILGRQENPVCGYISANISRPLSCKLPGMCASSSSFYGCCAATTSCFFPSSCIEYTTLSSGCDEACSSNTALLKCGISPFQSFPYCATRYWNEATLLTGFVCDQESSVTDEIYTTYVNEEIGQNTISVIGVVGVVTATTASCTTQTSTAPPSTSEILPAPSSTSKTLSSLLATASSSPSSTSEILPAPSSTSETLSSLPATASPSNNSTSRISDGAIAGIGVGVLASLLTGMGMILFYHYYTRYHRPFQPNASETSLSAQTQALNSLGPDTQVPRTTSSFGGMPRELLIGGSVYTQRELPATGPLEMQQIRSSKTH